MVLFSRSGWRLASGAGIFASGRLGGKMEMAMEMAMAMAMAMEAWRWRWNLRQVEGTEEDAGSSLTEKSQIRVHLAHCLFDTP